MSPFRVRSTEKIRQHKNKHKEQARGRTPRLAKASSDRAKLREVGRNSKKNKQDFSSTSGLQQVLEMRV
ncbi:hypothetical protein Taro_000999 [Colocasia esculenta]|uniref:Uncharacterized protein n=1 Tax=Colocasia esculenta TaxID=4460 RepID=A0A843TJG3_COLES|nr:hypothetical protein [Colocasia esculenta]